MNGSSFSLWPTRASRFITHSRGGPGGRRYSSGPGGHNGRALVFAQRAQPTEAARWGKKSLILGGTAMLLSSVLFGFLALFATDRWLGEGAWLVAAAVLVAVLLVGVRLIRRGIALGRTPDVGLR